MLYILFYSNYCKHSLKFIKFLEQTGEATHFAKVCVDKDQQTGLRPPLIQQYGITEVPTIVIENKLLPGNKAFNWLSNKIESSQHQVATMATRQNKQQVNMNEVIHQQESSNDVEPYMNITSSTNFTDNCVQLGNIDDTTIYTPDASEDIEKTGNFTLRDDCLTSSAHTTNFPSKQSKDSSRPIPSVSIKKDSLKSKQIENEYNKMLAEREASCPQPLRRM